MDGTAVAGRDVKDVLALVRGPSGTAVTIKARRANAEFTVELARGGADSGPSLGDLAREGAAAVADPQCTLNPAP